MTSHPKLALVVDLDILRLHVGVSTYVYSLYQILSQRACVELVIPVNDYQQWMRVVPADRNGDWLRYDDGLHFSGSATQVLRAYLKTRRQQRQRAQVAFHRATIGSSLAVEQYDQAILTVPWLAGKLDLSDACEALGLVYDVVPNEYALLQAQCPPGLLDFAAEHARGFASYAQHCQRILAISADAAAGYNRYFAQGRAPQACPLPALLPVHVAARDTAELTQCREANVVLASPFDPRKGLRELPHMLNSQADKISQVLIYGSPRCSKSELKQFFRELGCINVQWWPKASPAKVRELYLRSRALLFPSHHEGLGLPILESQACGCPVIVRDRSPMNGLAHPDSPLIAAQQAAAEQATASQALKMLLTRPWDATALRDWTLQNFDNRQLADHILGAPPKLRSHSAA